MKTFHELKQKFSQVHVTLVDGELHGSGLLRLAGADTKLSIATSGMLKHRGDPNGWFDLRLKGDNGSAIYLHNALILKERFPDPGETTYRYDAYPNVIVLGAEALTHDGKVESISFTVHKLYDFFRYQLVEWQLLTGAPKETLESLRQLREVDRKYPKDYEFFDPRTLFIIHRLPEAIGFRVRDRSYSVSVFGAHSFSWKDVDIETRARATITFDEAVDIDEALSYVWEWRRFFAQSAMQALPFESISIGRRDPADWSDAHVYLPDLDDPQPAKTVHFPFGPSRMPFNSWSERETLGTLMKRWLERQPDRIQFRAQLDHVIEIMHDRVDADHVMALASGLESLAELDLTSPYTADQIEVLVRAAHIAAAAAGIDANMDRLRGILGLLRKQNVGRRLQSLQDALGTSLPPHDRKKFNKTIQQIRNRAAHGTGGAVVGFQQLSRTIKAFAGLSALWDLTSSGLDIESAGKCSNAWGMVSHALVEDYPKP